MLLAIGLPHEVAHGSLRLSLSDYNTEEDVDYILEKLPEIVSTPALDESAVGADSKRPDPLRHLTIHRFRTGRTCSNRKDVFDYDVF